MDRFAILSLLNAPPGKEDDVEEFLKSAQPLVAEETGTTSWYAIKIGPASLGSEGLGLFVVGAYGAHQEHGGMLGYMQEHNATIWQEKIARSFRSSRAKLQMLKGGEYSAKTIISEPTGVHTSRHRRQNLPDITIHHTLLDFSSLN
jgi:hypothetical protein